jgi:hypothetical protein
MAAKKIYSDEQVARFLANAGGNSVLAARLSGMSESALRTRRRDLEKKGMTITRNEKYTGQTSFSTAVEKEGGVTRKAKARRMVITCAINNTPVQPDFVKMLENYCKVNRADLIVIPLRYRNPTSPLEASTMEEEWWDKSIVPYLCDSNMEFPEFRFKILGAIKTEATAVNPLTGMDAATRGLTTIMGHPQLQMKTLTTNGDGPIFLTTTGTCTPLKFSDTRRGYQAEFHQSLCAIVMEPDSMIGHAHMRQLHYHETGIVDLDKVYRTTSVGKAPRVEAVVLGDEHCVFASESVVKATFGAGGIVSTLKPKRLIRHDVLDCHAVSHHHKLNPILQYRKLRENMDDIFDELTKTKNHIMRTTPLDCESIIIASNHNEHLHKWLNEADWKRDIKNAKLFFNLMYQIFDRIDQGKDDIDPFKLFCGEMDRVRFLTRNEQFMILDIDVGNHGDKGANGTRGSRRQYSMLPDKTVVGHSHSPGIDKGCYQTGTSGELRMGYNDGPSSWANTHCIIYENGKRQLITTIDGRWRA